MVNKVILIGNVGKAPRGVGKSTFFSIATNYGEDVTWHNIVCYGKTKDFVDKYLDKGMRVFIEGRLSNVEKEGKFYTNVIVNNLRVLSWGSKDEEKVSEEPESPITPF